MLKISKMSDYAIVILAHLARQKGGLQNVAAIAAGTHLPEPTISKVLKSLNKCDVVSSVRGVAGGYKIAKAPVDITVYDIIVALEGPVALTACVDKKGNDSCDLAHVCAVHGRWDRVNIAIETALDNVTLADMMAPHRPAPRGQDEIRGTL